MLQHALPLTVLQYRRDRLLVIDTGSQGKAAQEELQRLLPARGMTITDTDTRGHR